MWDENDAKKSEFTLLFKNQSPWMILISYLEDVWSKEWLIIVRRL